MLPSASVTIACERVWGAIISSAFEGAGVEVNSTDVTTMGAPARLSACAAQATTQPTRQVEANSTSRNVMGIPPRHVREPDSVDGIDDRPMNVGRRSGGGETGACSHRAALAQHVERDAMALDRRRNPAIERDQQQDVANLIRRAAVGERAVDVDAKLVGAPDRRRHRDRGQRFGLERQRGTAPDIAIGISVDHVLQRLAERAERTHALLDRVAAEHLPAKLQPFVMQVARIHCSLLHHPAGVPTFSGDSLASRAASHSLAMIRRPVTPSDRGDISQTIGAIMTSGWIRVERSATSVAGIMRVLAGPPGASALTLTPVPARSFAQITVAASSAAFDGP